MMIKVECTRAEWLSLVQEVDPLETPRLLVDVAELMNPSVLAWALARTWVDCIDPAAALPRNDWLGLWRTAGFTEGGEATRRPGAPVRLWRGALPEWKQGMSWTNSRAAAEVFRWMEDGPDGRRTNYTGPPARLPGNLRITAPIQQRQSTRKRVYEVTAPPEALLGKIRILGVGPKAPREFIIDPSGLKVVPSDLKVVRKRRSPWRDQPTKRIRKKNQREEIRT